MPLSQATFAGDRIEVPYEKNKVKDAPRIDPDGGEVRKEQIELDDTGVAGHRR